MLEAILFLVFIGLFAVGCEVWLRRANRRDDEHTEKMKELYRRHSR